MDPTLRDSDSPSERPSGKAPQRRILITGGAGFLGVNAASHFIAQGWYVTLLDNLSRPGTERSLKWLITRYPNRVAFVKEDVRNAAALPAHVQNQDAVLHLAAQVAVTTSLADPTTDFEINARGTLNMLEAARQHNHDVPLLFASTNKVYGELDQNNGACKETQPIDLRSPYACSKGAADQYVRDYSRTYQMNTVVLRQSSVYGAHQHGTEDQGWVAHFVQAIRRERTVTVYGDGTQVRDLLDARDVCALYAMAIDKIGIARGEVYNVGGGPENRRTLLEVIERIGELMGRKPQVKFAGWRERDQRFYVSDISKAGRDLGWTPRVQFDRGLPDLISWVESIS